MKRFIETFRSTKTPWEVFQAVHASSRACFFLDSPQQVLPDPVYSYIGADPDLEIRLGEKTLRVEGEMNEKNPARELFPALKKILRKYQARGRNPFPFFTGGFVGYLGYEAADLCDKIKFRAKPAPAMPRLYLGLFRNVIVYDHQKRIYHIVANARGTGNGERAIEKIKAYFGKTVCQKRHFEFKEFTEEMTQGRFEGMVKKAKEYIAAGDIYQANLSQRFAFKYRGASLELYGKLRAINPSPFSCFLKTGDLEIVSSSPERLVRKKGRVCETRPIAGTCPARGSARRLGEWRKKLLQNEKEKAEHLMLVDLERNDLGRVCGYRSVKVEEFMTLEKYSHVVHIVSKITGKLKKGKDSLDVIQAMFPGGTITGCPKIRCMQIIDELEPVRRGLYTGSMGYIDLHGDMDLNIVIRTILLRRGKGHLQVGAGIVHDSDPEKEYKETLHKAEALTQALREASGTEQGVRSTVCGAKKIRRTPYEFIMNYKIYQNGKEVDGELPFDLVRTEAAGIFESMRAYRGKVLHEEDHLARLSESAKTVGCRSLPEAAKLRLEIKAALKAFGKKECYVRLTLWEGQVFVILGSREHPQEFYEKGVVLKTASFPRGGPNTFPWQAKASAYQQAILASTEPHPDKVYEWVFLDQQNFLTETRVGNFFIVKYLSARPGSAAKGRAVLLTPPEHGILNGVTRRFVIKCASELGIQVREVPLTRHEFFNADEAFLCNTSWEVLPVRELDGRVIGAGKPGPITLKLHCFFKRRVQQDVSPHRSPRAY